MRTKITIVYIFFICFSCRKNEEKFVNIKDNILYKDKKENIYLKRKIDIMSEQNSQYNQIRYFDNIIYKDSVLKLKEVVDVKSFKYINGVTDTLLNNKCDFFEDSKHIYKYQYLPATFPNIKVFDK